MVDTADLEELLGALDERYAAITDGFSLQEAWQQLKSGEQGSLVEAITGLLRSLLFGEILKSTATLAHVVILAVLALLLSVLKDSFAGGQVAAISRWVVSLLLISISMQLFFDAMQHAQEAVNWVADLMFVLLPLLFPLLAALGGITTVATMAPALLFVLNLLMTMMRDLIFPLIWFHAVLRMVSTLIPRFSVNKLSALCKDIAMGVMSITTTLFISFMSISGMASATRDGVAIKAAKTASSAFIPIVGRTLADTLDSVLGTVLVLKGAVGIIGVLALLLVCALPAVQILAQALLFRLAGALVQPMGDDALADALSGMGNSLILLFAALFVSCLFAFFALALVVGMGSMTVMMR